MTDKLIKGYERFRQGYFRQNQQHLEALSSKQNPEIAMISCCDSRVDPSILFDVKPGDIFIVRNVANLVPPYEEGGDYHGTSAALEFAVTCLNVKQLVVLGHANCGGIRALMESDSTIEPNGFIDSWMQIAAPAKSEILKSHKHCSLDEQINICEQTAVRYSLKNMMSYPWIKSRVEKGELKLIGLYYDLHSGELTNIELN